MVIENIYVVVSVYNRKDVTLSCLSSLSKQTYENKKIIVVDDGSTDGTSEEIGRHFPSTIILKGDGNLWWTGATNLGVQHVLKQARDEDFILTLNNDLTVSPNYLEVLHSAASAHRGSLIGSISVSDEDGSKVSDGGVRINWLTAKYIRLSRGKKYEEVISDSRALLQPVDFLPGRGTLIPVGVFRKIGVYDFARLPHYGADYEFSHRAKKNGYGLFIHYGAVVKSDVSSTGINNENRVLGWRELGKSFFSIRSPNSISYRWNFARLTCPMSRLPLFFAFDIGRVVIGALRNQLSRSISR